jgi:hypothetical protein
MNKIKKVIIWGHKFSHYHTHTHIHHHYYKAFRSLGYEVWWMDNDYAKDGETIDFSDALFFTEGQVDQKIPLVKNATYILHHCDNEKYLNAGGKVLNLCNYLKYCEEGKSFNYEGNTVEKISDLFFFDSKAPAIYQPWATDLLPEEIKEEDASPFEPSRFTIHYVGSIWWENHYEMKKFVQACHDNKKEFKHYAGGISDSDNRELIRNSYIAPDIRGEWHRECGYIPCRIFKNMSYGVPTGINSPHVKEIFGDRIAYSDNSYDLFSACVEKAKITEKKEIQDNMRFIKENHTYINRINNIFYILERI